MRTPASPAKILPRGERERRPLSPATAISRAAARCAAPAPPRQIPAVPSSPLFARERIEKGNDEMEQDNRESWLNQVAIGMPPHAQLDTAGETTAPRRQARMLKCECQTCGYTSRPLASGWRLPAYRLPDRGPRRDAP